MASTRSRTSPGTRRAQLDIVDAQLFRSTELVNANDSRHETPPLRCHEHGKKNIPGIVARGPAADCLPGDVASNGQ